jgi:hypothetical protein
MGTRHGRPGGLCLCPVGSALPERLGGARTRPLSPRSSYGFESPPCRPPSGTGGLGFWRLHLEAASFYEQMRQLWPERARPSGEHEVVSGLGPQGRACLSSPFSLRVPGLNRVSKEPSSQLGRRGDLQIQGLKNWVRLPQDFPP